MLRRKIVMSMKMRLSILVFAFIIAIGNISAAQYSGSCGTGLSWSLNTSDGVLQIKGWGTTMYTWNKASDVPWYTYRSYVKTIVIPNSLTSIGNYAFYGLSNILSIEIPDNVSNIGDYAFWGCSKLESINISKNITTIGTNAFRGCAKLTLVTIDSNMLISASYYGGSGNCNSMFGDQVTQYELGPNVQSIGGWVFYKCKNLKSIIISDNIKTIEGYAFEESGLQSITIGSGLSRIDNYAFRACTQLTSLNINSNHITSSKSIKDVFGTQVATCILGDSIRTIGESAFSGCVNMKSITIGCNVAEIKKDAFRNCSNLTDITIPQNVTTIGRTVFYGCSKLKSIVWNAKHVVTVWNSSSSAPFYDIRSQIESFTLGDSVEVVPYWVCYEMNHITSITFPEKLNAIRDNAFVGCSGLTCPIVIPDNVTYLGQGAFDNCSNIPSAIIGDGVTNIYGFTFGDCTNLTSITIGKNVSHVELGAFYGCNRLNSIVWNAINCEDFSNNKTPFYSRGELAEDVLIARQIKSFTFGDEVQSIPAYLCYAMHCCEVTIPNSVIRIGANALYRFNSGCSGHITIFLGIVQDLASDIGLTPTPYRFGDRIYVPCGSLEYYREKIPRRPEIIQNYPSQYSLNLIANHTQGAIASNAEPSICDSIIEITAIPNEGYHFTQWSDGNTDNPRTIVLTQDTTFTAEFAKNTYTISTTSANPEWGTTAGDTAALYLDEVEISAIPNYGYHFVRWNDNNTSNPRTVSVTEDKTYTATFAKNVYSITKNAAHGSISGNSSAEYLDEVTLSANPDYGYHFTQWSDGLKDNPRIFQITKDTTFTAVFAYDRVGTCGKDLALVWSYDPTNKVLTIGNAGSFTENMQFGVEAPNEMEELVIGNSVTAIGANAFAGIETLKKVSIGESVKTIGEQAFLNCVNLETIFNYRPTPTNTYSNAFDGVDKFECALYVLPSSIDMYKAAAVWRDFYYTYAIGAEEATVTTNDVTVEPQDNAATVTWPTNDNAATYTLQITKDGVVFCTLIFNANGQLTGIAFAPSRDGSHHAPAAVMTAKGMQFTVTGLDSGTHYALTLQAKDDQETVLASYSSEFTTTGQNAPQGLDEISSSLQGGDRGRLILHEGQIFILRGDKTYTLTGAEVK